MDLCPQLVFCQIPRVWILLLLIFKFNNNTASGWFASGPSVLHRVGHALLRLNPLESKRIRRVIIADDIFQLSQVPLQKTVYVVSKAIEKLSGYQTPKHMHFGQYIASNVPSLKLFYEESTNQQTEPTLRALSSAMLLLQRYEFKTNYEEWVKSVKPKLGPDVSSHVWAAIETTQEDVKSLYKVRKEMRAALQSLLKDDGILVIPSVSDPPPKLNSRKHLSIEFHERMYAMLGIASMSGGCQVAIPLGNHDDSPVLYHLLHHMELINSYLIPSWMCILLFKNKSTLFLVRLYYQIPVVTLMLLNFLKKR